MMPEFPADAVISMEPVTSEQLTKEGWGPYVRENWGDGPWRDEPDRVKWVDPATGYRCEIRRNRVGSLCGYAIIPEDHIWHGIGYSGCINQHAPLTPEERLANAQASHDAASARHEAEPTEETASTLRCAKMILDLAQTSGWMSDYKEYPCLAYDREDRCSSPESVLNVHGGVTFSGTLKDMDGWAYGFDCGHYMDFAPGMEATRRWVDTQGEPNPYRDPESTYDPTTGIKHEHGVDEVYRDMSYVKDETESLAKQLWAINKVGV